MRDLKDRLRGLSRTPEASPRSRGGELRARLDRLLGPGAVVTAAELEGRRRERGVDRVVHGRRVPLTAGEVFLCEACLPAPERHGRLSIAELGGLPSGAATLFPEHLGGVPAGEIAFLDTETTGLAGGAGTVAFLIGVGRWSGEGFRVAQLFLEDLDREQALLEALAAELEGVRCLVTYNGAAFDVPLLENRHVLARRRWPVPRAAHLDLLPPSRLLWKWTHADCRLETLERGVLGYERRGDVPGSDIPRIYTDYLRRGAGPELAAVFDHNRRDVVSLAGLLWASSRAAAGNEAGAAAGVGFLHARRGRRGEARTALESCLSENLAPAVKKRVLRELALACKACGEWERALELWSELLGLSPSGDPVPVEELAKVLEHRLRRPGDALAAVERALAAGPWRPRDREALERRRARLGRVVNRES